ncbi:MAG: tetratricopeptide repeat protein [Acidobacteriota bacterium]
MKEASTRLTKDTPVLDLIEEAQNAELCRNLELSQSIFAPIWSDIDHDPEFTHFDPSIRASLFRLCGFFLSFYGHSKGRIDFQLRGKDLLTQAIGLFDEEGLTERSAESQVMLAVCYWYSGEIEEAETILKVIEQTFEGNELHPVYLQIKVNKLMVMFWKGEFQPGIEIIEQIATPMEVCQDNRLKTMFHNQAGILFNVLSRYEAAIYHLDRAVHYARELNNRRFIVSTLNNLAFSNKQLGRFGVAHELLDRAEEINLSLKDFGWMPHVLDTRALVYLDQDKPGDALTQIERAIEMFNKGEDFAGHVDSIWTKCRCLLRMNLLDDALTNFADLQSLAKSRIGESAAKKYSSLFSSEIYCINATSLQDSVRGFKKFMILKAMREANGGIVEASKLLGLKNHQALSEMLNKQFPEIFEELGIKRRSRRQDAKDLKPVVRRSVQRDISRIKASGRLKQQSGSLETFYFSGSIMERFGIGEESLVTVAKPGKLEAGVNLLYTRDGEFFVNDLLKDKLTGLFFFNVDGSEILVDEVQLIGIPTGYCPLSMVDTEQPTFEQLS